MTTMTASLRIRTAIAFAGVLCATTAHAQSDTTVRIDEHWRGYLGCWSTSAGGVVGPMVCIAPTASAQTVEFVSVDRDSITSRTLITASGERVERTRDKCKGWESGRWSMDERRLYTHAEFTCPGGTTQQQDGMLTMTSADEFSRIDGVKTRSGTRTRVVHFQLVMDSTLYPASIAARIPSVVAMPSFGARMEAAAEISPADVVDASKELDSPLVEAWLGDRKQKFALGVSDLRALHSSKVPEGVIDMMVALSNPRFFTLAQGGAPAARAADPFVRGRGYANEQVANRLGRICESLQRGATIACDDGFGWTDAYFPWSGYPIYRGFYSNFYGGYGAQWGPYGPIYAYPQTGGWYGSNTPIVIIPTTPRDTEQPGRVINGQGYSQGGASGGGQAEPRSPNVGSDFGGSSSSGSSSSGGGSGGGGGGASSSGSSNSGGGEQRTAKPRP
jgi:hypothetical protein